jgi:hypothetical protein
MNYYHLNVRWAPRNDPLSDCAERFARMLDGLAAIHPHLADWRRKANTRTAAFKPFCATPPRAAELELILIRGRHFTSASRKLIPELGYSVAAWNGLDEPQSLSLSLSAGAYYKPWLYPNMIEIEGLGPGNVLVDSSLLKRILLIIASCWEADWGVVENWAYEGLTVDSRDKPLLPYGGWLTYLSQVLAERISPPRGVIVEPTPDAGLFMLISHEPLDVANPLHVARLDAVQKALAPVQRALR